jgi:arginine exporter protein ArgO
MNEFIKLEIPFNENKGRENQQFFFRYKWKKGFTELKKAVIYALIFLLLGFFSQSKLINNSPASVIFRYTGFIFLAYIFLLLYQFFTSKKKFYKSLEEQISDFKQKTDKASSFIILNKDNITIENSFNTIGSVWSKTNYTFADKYLILGILNSNFNFVFTKTDFKEDDYKTFTNFLEQYSREQK